MSNGLYRYNPSIDDYSHLMTEKHPKRTEGYFDERDGYMGPPSELWQPFGRREPFGEMFGVRCSKQRRARWKEERLYSGGLDHLTPE